MTAKIEYLLSEEGRKKSLLAGGDGKEVQMVVTDITPELLELARVNADGTVILKLTGYMVLDVEIEMVGVHGLDCPRPRWDEQTASSCNGQKYFDAPQTAETLISWDSNRRKHVEAKKAELQPKFDRLQTEYEAAKAEKLARDEDEKAQRLATVEAANAKTKAERDRLEAEKLEWIQAHGSEYLKDAVSLGYNCQRQYVTERAEMEFPDFDVDFGDNAKWTSRSCPSPEALQEVKELVAAGHEAEVVWLTDDGAEREDWEDFESCEAIVIRNYLGRYDLVKTM